MAPSVLPNGGSVGRAGSRCGGVVAASAGLMLGDAGARGGAAIAGVAASVGPWPSWSMFGVAGCAAICVGSRGATEAAVADAKAFAVGWVCLGSTGGAWVGVILLTGAARAGFATLTVGGVSVAASARCCGVVDATARDSAGGVVRTTAGGSATGLSAPGPIDAMLAAGPTVAESVVVAGVGGAAVGLAITGEADAVPWAAIDFAMGGAANGEGVAMLLAPWGS